MYFQDTPFQTVNNDAGHHRPVRIVEYFGNLHAFGRLGEANHIVRTTDLDEGESRLVGKLGGQGGLASIRSALPKKGLDSFCLIWTSARVLPLAAC